MMAVRADGTITGTVGGGILEAQAMEAGLQVQKEGGGTLLSFDLTDTDAAQSGMICGGAGRMAAPRVSPAALPAFCAAPESLRFPGGDAGRA